MSSTEDEWDAAFAAPSNESKETSSEADTAEPMYPDVESWVTGWLAPITRRKITRDMTWCPEWWRHGEAIVRLIALWRAWEQLRTDSTTGMSIFMRDHFDPHMAVLLNRSNSPFVYCSPAGHQEEADPLPVQPAPEGWWNDTAA